MNELMTEQPVGEAAVKRAPTVYFIDDSATMREVIKIAFRRENINVITCADAASALAQFDQNRPDIVITDVIMPDQDGYAVCSQIKQHPEFGGIPVVLMSGVVNKSVADKAVAVHADELMRKPFQPQELIGRVKALLAPKAPPVAAARMTSEVLHNVFAAPVAPVSATVAAPPAPVPVAVEAAPVAEPVAEMQIEPIVEGSQSPAEAEYAGVESYLEEIPEPVWPRALVEAFAPLLPPFGQHARLQNHAPAQSSAPPHQVMRPTTVQEDPGPGVTTPASHGPAPVAPAPVVSSDVSKLRAEIARLELQVKKLQTELQLERDYTQAVEQQIKALLAS